MPYWENELLFYIGLGIFIIALLWVAGYLMERTRKVKGIVTGATGLVFLLLSTFWSHSLWQADLILGLFFQISFLNIPWIILVVETKLLLGDSTVFGALFISSSLLNLTVLLFPSAWVLWLVTIGPPSIVTILVGVFLMKPNSTIERAIAKMWAEESGNIMGGGLFGGLAGLYWLMLFAGVVASRRFHEYVSAASFWSIVAIIIMVAPKRKELPKLCKRAFLSFMILGVLLLISGFLYVGRTSPIYTQLTLSTGICCIAMGILALYIKTQYLRKAIAWELEDQLRELKEQLGRGVITQEEYEQKKEEVAGKI